MEKSKKEQNDKSNPNSSCAKNCGGCNSKLGGVGGQAVLEGVMMKSKDSYAIAVRKENGDIVYKKGINKSIGKKCFIFRLPIIRGIVNLIESLSFSFKTLSDSAEMAGMEFEEEPSKFEKWLEKKFGKSIINFVTVIASILGVLLAVGLFIFLPSALVKGLEFLIERVSPIDTMQSGMLPGWAFNLIEGLFKIIIFILYIFFTSKLSDIKRVYQYHGAEHKSIFCYEKEEELTVENVKKQSRFHPRCGTSFIFVVMIISIAVMTIFTTLLEEHSSFMINNIAFRSLLKIMILPLTVGISYEFIRYAGRHTNLFTRILSAPGLWMQRLTTREPDEKMIEVAIASLKAALPEEFPEEAEIIDSLIKAEEEKKKQEAEKEAKQETENEATENNDGIENNASDVNNTDANTETTISNTDVNTETTISNADVNTETTVSNTDANTETTEES